MHDVHELQAVALSCAVAAARLVRDERPARLSTATKSTSTDVVTEMDKRSEELITQILTRLRPTDGLLGEEGADGLSSTGITWVLDPIDGTVNYLYEIPAYAVSVAAVTGDPRVPGAWETIAAAVASPAEGLVYTAARGHGAYVLDLAGLSTDLMSAEELSSLLVSTTPLHTNEVRDLGQSLVATGFAYSPQIRAEQGVVAARVLPTVRDIRRGGSCALDLCSVAQGRLDGYYERGVNVWDCAGGILLVTEAGGRVSGGQHRPVSTAGIVAAAPGIFDELDQLIERSSALPIC